MLTWILVACGPRTAAVEGGPGSSVADYLPLTPGAVWSYEATFNGRAMSEDRTVIALDTAAGPAFAFVETADLGDSEDSLYTFTGMFGLGAYQRDGDRILTADASWGREFAGLQAEDFEPLLPALQVGQQVTYRTSSPDRGRPVTVEGFEEITVPAGTFPNAVRLHLGEGSYAWLAPGVGLVKWVYLTGREEALTGYTPAP